MTEYKNGNDRWIEQGFKNSPDVETVHEFQEQVMTRKESLTRTLPSDALDFRTQVRNMLGFSEDDEVVFFGEQPTGLNEPPLVLGKRLLFAHGQRKYNWRGLEISASADVIGSERGLYRAIIPDTIKTEGFTEIQMLNWNRKKDVPAYVVSNSDVDVKKTENALRNSYPFKFSLVSDRAGVYLSAWNNNASYSDTQKRLMDNLLRDIGIDYNAVQIEDHLFETQITKMGALDLIMRRWKDISLSAAGNNEIPSVKVPDPSTLPFFVIDERDGRRASVVESGTPNLYHLAHPKNPERIFTQEPLSLDYLTENYQIAYRAIPRIMLYSLITDGQITGGGALYNVPSAMTFKEIFTADYFPQIWMNVNTDGKGLFDYQSMATSRRAGRPGYEAAENLVAKGRAASIDLMVSHPEHSREIVGEYINMEDLETQERVNLRK